MSGTEDRRRSGHRNARMRLRGGRTVPATLIGAMSGTSRFAREAALNGDTVEAENCYQHAEHYFRVMQERAA